MPESMKAPDVKGATPKEKTPNRQEEEGVIVAEDIAKARMVLEDEILSGRLASWQWLEFYAKEVKPKFPRIAPYNAFFTECIAKAAAAEAVVREIIAECKKDIRSEASAQELPKILFKKIAGKDPVGEVEIDQGAVNLNFIVYEEEDFQALWGQGKVTKTTEGFKTSALTSNGKELPIVVIKSGEENAEIKTHELEHVKNDLIEAARKKKLHDLLAFKEKNPITATIRFREARTLKVQNWAKDEILASFTGNPNSIDGKKLSLIQTGQLLKLMLGPGGQYYSRYFQGNEPLLDKDLPISEQEKMYQSTLGPAIDAFVKLANIYQGDIRMTVNVLEQFPLNIWRGVVRLIETRNRNR